MEMEIKKLLLLDISNHENNIINGNDDLNISIPSPNTHIVGIIFATIILIIVIINDGNNVILSVKRTTTNSITTMRRGRVRGHDLNYDYYSCCCSCSYSRRNI